MTWILFVILLDADKYYVSPQAMYQSAEECIIARDYFFETAPQPKINYDAVCIPTDKVTMN